MVLRQTYYYDYTCMETLQGLSASELSSAAGRKWRTIYSDPENTKREAWTVQSGRRSLNVWSNS